MKLPRSFIAVLALSATTASATSPANPAQAPSASPMPSTHVPAPDTQALRCLTVEPQQDFTLERDRVQPTSERDRLCGPWRLIPAGHALPDLSQLRPVGDIPTASAQQDAEPEQI